MAAPEPTAVADTPTTTDLPLRLVCTEAWGGNRFIDAPFEVPGVRGRLYSQPATGGSGGDVHCLAICNSGVLSHFCLADVVGHGDQVAAVGREIHGIIRQMLDAFDQRRILRKLNRQLYDGSFGRMTTAALASYEPPLGRLSISYAGHPPGWLYRAAEKRWTRLPLAKPPASDRRLADAPLAIDGATRFNRRTVRVSRGDRLLLVTDGVLEASDAAGTLFGDAGLQALLDGAPDMTPDALVTTVLAALVDHSGDAGLEHDDVSLLAAEFVKGPNALDAMWMMVRNRMARLLGGASRGEGAYVAG